MSIADILIINWLNDELKFEPKISDIYNDFKNGYYFGQLLSRLGLIKDEELNLYKISNESNDIKNNFSLLNKNLNESLGYKLRKEEIYDLVNKKNKYNITILIYKIKNTYYKYKIHFNGIKDSLEPMSPKELCQKVKLILEYNNNEKNEDNKVDEIFLFPKEKLRKLKRIKIQKVSFSSGPKKEKEFPGEKSFIQKRIILPKIQRDSCNQNLNLKYDSNIVNLKKGYKSGKNKILNRNKSQLYFPKYKPYSIGEIIKEQDNNKINDKDLYDLNKEVSYGSKSFSNICEKRISAIKAKFAETNKAKEDSGPEYNFIKKDEILLRNIINKLTQKQNAFDYLEKNFKLYNVSENSKYKSAFKRKEYSDIWKRENEKNIVIKRLNHFNNLFYNIRLSQKLKPISSSTDIINRVNKEEKNKFNPQLFFKEVDSLDLKEFNKYCEKKKNTFKKHYIIFKELALLIIKVTMEGYIYQAETKKDLIDIPFYIKLIKLFLKNKFIKRKTIIDEFKIIKEVGKINEEIDFTNIKLNKEEILFLKDYYYLIGFWNKNRILDTDLLGKKLDYKFIFYNKNKVEEYEPTEMEHEDLTFPSKLISDYDFGDFISEFIEYKYSKNIIQNNTEEENQISKWFYIGYKIVLVGQSFLGNKYIAQQFNKKYPNLKIYSVHKLLNDYCNQYKNILNEPEEKITKAKSKKGNQEAAKKKSNKEKLEELKPILDIIKPYLEQEQNKTQTEENNNKNISIIVPNDELLLKLLIYQIEKDFPKKTKKEVAEEAKENMEKINTILDKIEEIKNNIEYNESEKENEKSKAKDKKGKKDKEEKNLDNLEKELEKLKLQSIKGFILVDFPNNLNQCYLLENYLTGYNYDIQKPKSLKYKEIEKINEIIDIKPEPKKETKLKTPGIDYLINLSSKEKEINTLFKDIKYDPIEDTIYSKLDLDILNDKKLSERLIDHIYYYDNNSIEYYRNEYEENISKIHLFYDKFGYYLEEKQKNNSGNIFVKFDKKATIKNNDKLIKVYQTMLLADLNQPHNLNANGIDNKKNKKFIKVSSIKSNRSTKSNKSNKEKKEKEEERGNKDENADKNKINNLSPLEIYQIATTNIIEFFSKRIEILSDSINQRNITLIDSTEADKEIARLSELKRVKTKKTLHIQEKDKIIYSLKSKTQELLSSILSLNENYKTNLEHFIYLLINQRNDILNRFNLIQKKFRDYLNRETNKKSVIHKYVLKYNNFFDTNKDLLTNESVEKEFMTDIEFININLWQIINLKKRESIAELNAIKTCGYIEVEMCKFLNNIKKLFFLETNKYINMINTLIDFYMKFFINDKITSFKSSNNITNIRNSNTQNILQQLKEEVSANLENINKNKENLIFNDLIPFDEILEKENDKNNENMNNNIYNFAYLEKQNQTKYNLSLNKKINLLTKNVKILFFNCIKCMISENDIIVPFLKLLSEINNSYKKKITFKAKKTMVINNDNSPKNNVNEQIINTNSIISEEVLQNIIKNEKNKLKYRLCFIKDFAIKYMIIISKISLKIFNNADEWVIRSIHKENETQNEVINILKAKLNQIERIDEEIEINSIEMDAFEKKIDDEEKNSSKISDIKIKPIDNTSVISLGIYNKINIDFLVNDNFFDIQLNQIDKNQSIEINKQTLNEYINEIKEYEVSIPKTIGNYIGNYCMTSEKSNISNEEELIKEEDFYYDIEKLFDIYKEISSYEEEKNIISYNNLFETFIKPYLINNNEKKIKGEYNAISNNLKKLNIKQILRLIEICKLNFERKNEEKDVEYETYIKTQEIFTLLFLINSTILTGQKEEQILNYFKDKFIKGKYIRKNEFMKYHFWFEKFFYYYKNNNINEIDDELKNNEKDVKMNIKDLLFALWNDGNDKIDLKKLLEVLKMSNYITDFIEYNGKRYFDIIFSE